MAVHPWVGNDAGYEDWLAAHPAGFQANTGNPPTGVYFRIHRATCRLPDRSQPGSINPRTGRKYSKLTADTVAELVAWAATNLPGLTVLGPANYCRVCVPTDGTVSDAEPGAAADGGGQ